MEGRTLLGRSSSLFVSTPGLIAFGGGALLALRLDCREVAGLLVFFLLLGLVCRWWGKRAIDGVSIHVECREPRLFPGQQTKITYRVENHKVLPLVWLELSQNAPEDECLIPDEAFESYLHPAPQGQEGEMVSSLRQSFSFVGSWQSVEIESTWTAQRRGIYCIHRLLARTGDGFGLAQGEYPLPAGQIPTLAVYPKLVDVDLSLFLRLQWDCAAGRHGWMEDFTVLRGSREYQPGDNWKHINWRMAAREQDVQVNLYQTIQPGGMRFFLDGESFCGVSPQWEELEESIEILASILTGLVGQGIDCSLSLPQSKHFPPVTVSGGEDGNAGDILFYLAGYRCLAEREDLQGGEHVCYKPSLFSKDAIPQTGTVYLLTYSGTCLPKDILDHVDPGQLWILCLKDWQIPSEIGFRALPLRELKRGEAVL